MSRCTDQFIVLSVLLHRKKPEVGVELTLDYDYHQGFLRT